MEIFELRYFLEVARHENVHRASEKLRVSPGSLSKAIGRIEGELKIKLFARDGRNIRLTEQGKLLKLRAAQIIALEENTRREVAGHEGSFQVLISGPEVLLSRMGLEVAGNLKKKNPNVTFEFRACEEQVALDEVSRGETHLALVTTDVPAGLTSRLLAETTFLVGVGPGHELHALAKARKSITIENILKHAFVSPSRPILGQVGLKQSLDGWRDDRFTRKVDYLTTSLKLLERLVTSGQALAYLPDYYAEELGLLTVKVTGCPYSCAQKIKLVARRPQDTGWLNQLF